MTSSLPDTVLFDLRDRFGADRLDEHGKAHSAELHAWISELDTGSICGLDLRQLRYVGYSYAKQTIRDLLRRRNDGEFGELQLFLIADQGAEFLDGTAAALREAGMFMLVAAGRSPLQEAELIGDVPQSVAEVFAMLASGKAVPTGTIAKQLNISPQNAKNRLDRLDGMGLLRRQKITSPTGGLEWENRLF